MGNTIIFILGPTSSGKSAVAVRFAERLKGEIVSCDSMQVYKDMSIITQAPGQDFLSRARHHLIGIIPSEQEFNAAEFVKKANEAVSSIFSKGKVPIFAGGTGLYVKAFVDGIFSSPPKDEEYRKSLNALALEKGKRYLYDRLKEIDPVTRDKLHPNDLRRIIRVLEIYELTGKTFSVKKAETKGVFGKYDCRMFGLKLSREVLYRRIEKRVSDMFEKGIVDEVKNLRKGRISLTAGKALGIKEVSDFLDGKISLERAQEELKKNTRRYAKRQLTWFRQDKRIEWIAAENDIEDVITAISIRLNPNFALERG